MALGASTFIRLKASHNIALSILELEEGTLAGLAAAVAFHHEASAGSGSAGSIGSGSPARVALDASVLAEEPAVGDGRDGENGQADALADSE